MATEPRPQQTRSGHSVFEAQEAAAHRKSGSVMGVQLGVCDIQRSAKHTARRDAQAQAGRLKQTSRIPTLLLPVRRVSWGNGAPRSGTTPAGSAWVPRPKARKGGPAIAAGTVMK
ncbi:hypothetical protein CPLU01_05942 [Colletotrichum plurivorum]|uniref:Uncharacterized protein n=1 Tax=Colletotrichum plurivorum TaxID=2175906 RepID=A0A8H6KKX9_9PEZI|nr:hypothetical protein CPLU01_05942 [Colletotrichum plurivorum]